MPREVQDLIHWKASEMKMFFFYYAIPVLEGIMTDEYFNHFLRLMVASAILSSDKIINVMIDVADDLLHRFVIEFEDIYGIQFCSINVHLPLHLSSCVRNLGRLWAYSCYEYEDLNGKIVKLVHGTWHLDTQIAAVHSQFIRQVRFIEDLPNGKIRDFCLKKKNKYRS